MQKKNSYESKKICTQPILQVLVCVWRRVRHVIHGLTRFLVVCQHAFDQQTLQDIGASAVVSSGVSDAWWWYRGWHTGVGVNELLSNPQQLRLALVRRPIPLPHE